MKSKTYMFIAVLMALFGIILLMNKIETIIMSNMVGGFLLVLSSIPYFIGMDLENKNILEGLDNENL